MYMYNAHMETGSKALIQGGEKTFDQDRFVRKSNFSYIGSSLAKLDWPAGVSSSLNISSGKKMNISANNSTWDLERHEQGSQ